MEDANSGLMRDLVDFNNRDEFNHYMKSMEKSYYQKANIPNPPYESPPDFPAKPFQAPLKSNLTLRLNLKKRRNEESRRTKTSLIRSWR